MATLARRRGPPFSFEQRLVGGITVLFHLAPAVSTAHAGLAEIFFSMTVAIALFTSPGWNADTPSVHGQRMRHTATATTVAVYA
jgi:heme A synthase